MIRSLYTAVSGMITQEAKQDVITNNMANAGTVGYKGDNLAIKQFKDVMIRNYDTVQNGKRIGKNIGSLSLGSAIDDTNIDFTQGDIQDTGKDNDFAVDGPGFFVVQRNNGVNTNQYYTRDGHFHVNMQGNLVNDSGDLVMGTNLATGVSEPINVGNGKLTADAYGNIRVDGQLKYKMQLANFNENNANNLLKDYKSLKKIGDNLYEDTGNNLALSNNITIRQGSLEKSNVNIINEMANMMTTMRSFETDQKVVQSIDETLGKTVNDVGKV
ncbi:MAG: flagellar hook-basal body complex protein [Bacillota bacterium]|nr:flagellar hook-basal body complex protein [Bacillota bacterium]